MSSDWKTWIDSKINEFDDTLGNTIPGYGTAKKIALNTVSLGGQAALDTSKQFYEEERKRYNSGATNFNKLQAEIRSAAEVLGTTSPLGLCLLRKLKS